MPHVKDVLVTEGCKGAGKFYCGTCAQFLFRWHICNYEIKTAVGSP